MSRFCMEIQHTLLIDKQWCSDDGLADTRPPMLVTASVDAIHMRHQLSMDNDMMVEGRVYASSLAILDMHMRLRSSCTSVSKCWY